MLNHLSIGVSSLERSIAFYDASLTPLGYCRIWSNSKAAGYGYPGAKDEPFAIKQEDGPSGLGSSPRSHIAFTAKSPDMVVAFHTGATTNGGLDLGKPGIRPEYGEKYFAAFVADPDGYKIEAVCHG